MITRGNIACGMFGLHQYWANYSGLQRFMSWEKERCKYIYIDAFFDQVCESYFSFLDVHVRKDFFAF